MAGNAGPGFLIGRRAGAAGAGLHSRVITSIAAQKGGAQGGARRLTTASRAMEGAGEAMGHTSGFLGTQGDRSRPDPGCPLVQGVLCSLGIEHRAIALGGWWLKAIPPASTAPVSPIACDIRGTALPRGRVPQARHFVVLANMRTRCCGQVCSMASARATNCMRIQIQVNVATLTNVSCVTTCVSGEI